jgi:hypothetical protein
LESFPTLFEGTLFLPSFVAPSRFVEPDVANIDAGGGGGALDGAALVLSLPDGFTEAFSIVFEATLFLSSTDTSSGAAEDGCFESRSEPTNIDAGGGGGALDGAAFVSSLPDGFTKSLLIIVGGKLSLPLTGASSGFVELDAAKIDAGGGGGGALDGAAFVSSLPDGCLESFPTLFEDVLSSPSIGAKSGAAEDGCFESRPEVTNDEAGGGGGAFDGANVVSNLPGGFTEPLPIVSKDTFSSPSVGTFPIREDDDIAKDVRSDLEDRSIFADAERGSSFKIFLFPISLLFDGSNKRLVARCADDLAFRIRLMDLRLFFLKFVDTVADIVLDAGSPLPADTFTWLLALLPRTSSLPSLFFTMLNCDAPCTSFVESEDAASSSFSVLSRTCVSGY